MTQTDADHRLAQAFALDLPSARDPEFSLAIMDRMARRQCLAELASAGVLAAVAALVLWPLWPVLAKALDPVVFDAWQAVAPAAAAVTVTVTMLAFAFGFGQPGQRTRA